MDLTAPLKTEVIRPLVTLVVPGAIAIGPFVLLLGDYVQSVAKFWTEHPSASSALIILAVLAAGFIIEDIGTLVETGWDARLRKSDPQNDEIWRKYLQLELKDELIGQRYLRTRVTVLKFELAMASALVVFWVGLFWLQAKQPVWSCSTFVFISIFIFVGAGSLLWGSWKTRGLLAWTQKLIVEAIEKGPKGIRSEGKH